MNGRTCDVASMLARTRDMAVSSEGDRFLKNNALGTVTHVSARLGAAAPLLAIHRLRTFPIISASNPLRH